MHVKTNNLVKMRRLKKKFITNNVKMIFGGNAFILRSFLSYLFILRFPLSPPVLDLA